MEGTLVSFRRGKRTQRENHALIQVKGVESRKDAAKLVGKKVMWKTSSGKEINGKIAAAHGNKGVVRAIFERGLPGQSMTQKVNLS